MPRGAKTQRRRSPLSSNVRQRRNVMPSVKHISASQPASLVASHPAKVEIHANVLGLGRRQAAKTQFNKRPRAASGEAKNSRFAAERLNFRILILVRWAAAAYKSTLRPNHWGGSKNLAAQLQSGTQPSTLYQPHALPNPSLKRTQRRVALVARRRACGPFCAGRPARHTVGASLARTLGSAGTSCHQ